jgi:hypothetical protein
MMTQAGDDMNNSTTDIVWAIAQQPQAEPMTLSMCRCRTLDFTVLTPSPMGHCGLKKFFFNLTRLIRPAAF